MDIADCDSEMVFKQEDSGINYECKIEHNASLILENEYFVKLENTYPTDFDSQLLDKSTIIEDIKFIAVEDEHQIEDCLSDKELVQLKKLDTAVFNVGSLKVKTEKDVDGNTVYITDTWNNLDNEDERMHISMTSDINRNKANIITSSSVNSGMVETFCDRTLTTKFNLKTPTVDKQCKCNWCDKSFNCKSKLRSHIRFHTGERPFKCHICEKKFSEKQNLNEHINSHTGEKPYKCNLCEIRCSTRSILVKHIRIHTGEKPYKCHLCEKSFSQNSNLHRHIKIHTREIPYECSLCKKRFSRKDHLRGHLKTHTPKEPYRCHLCEKYFYRKNCLIKHRTIHTRENPNKCN